MGAGFLAWVLDTDKEGSTVGPLRVALEKRVKSIWLSFGPNLGKWVEYIRQYDSQRTNEHKTLLWMVVNSVEEARKAVEVWKADVLVVQGESEPPKGVLPSYI